MTVKNTIVTGAGSFLGRAMIKKLKSAGYEVTALRHSFDEENPVYLDKAAPDCWLHFAWAGPGSLNRKDPEIQKYNIDMSLNALKKAMEIGCHKFIFAGSQAEYGHAQDGGLKKENGPAKPLSEYARAKLLFGQQALDELKENKSAMQYIHMRIFSVYGPGDHEDSLINTLKKDILKGKEVLLGDCSQLWDYIYIDDLAEALYLLCEKGETGIYNIGSGDIRPLREYVLKAADIFSSNKQDEIFMSPDLAKHTKVSYPTSNFAPTASSHDAKISDPLKLLHFGFRSDNAEGNADLSPDISKITALGFKSEISFENGIRKLISI